MDNNSNAMVGKQIIQFILSNPDVHIGHTSNVTKMLWVYDSENEKMIQREITYAPGLYKIFDTILVNAADNKKRDAKMDTIKINIDTDNNTISVWNNGKGIPIEFNKKQNMYVPTMRFGCLSISNYDDDDGEEKVTCGKREYDFLFCNVFCSSFIVETASKQYEKSFKQTWNNNMRNLSKPELKEYHGNDFTRVTFSPDLKQFEIGKLDKDIVDLMSRRAYDCAATLKDVKVILNGTRIGVKNFKEYCELYTRGQYDHDGKPLKIAHSSCGPNWQVALTLSTTGYEQVSFVNSIATTDGGSHVEHVTKLIVGVLSDLIKKKKYSLPITNNEIEQSMWIFVNCSIDNPNFNPISTKEQMTSQIKNFDSKFEISDEFKDLIAEIGIIESVLHVDELEADLILQKLKSKEEFEERRIAPPSTYAELNIYFNEESTSSEFEDDEYNY